MKRSSMLAIVLASAGLCCLGLLTANARQPIVSGQSVSELTAIVGATLIDGTGAAARPATVIIRGERIEAVTSPDTKPPAGARIINAEGRTLLPGIFDLHTHLQYASGGGVSGDWAKHLKAYLYCGVTSVVDFGTYPETFEPMRRLIKTGVILAPRISLAARISTPGGHGAEGGRGDFFSLEVSSAREARAAVRRVLPYQPDVIKVFTDGWRYGAAPDMTSMNEETLTALVDEAHKNGLEVLTHTVSLDKAKIAARSKVDVIAHGVGDKPVDEELFKAMKASGTSYVPTLAVYEPRARDILTPLLDAVLEPAVKAGINPPLVAPQNPPLKPAAGSAENGDAPRLRRWQILQNNTAALRQAGVNFGTGTDAGVTGTHHGWATLRELELLVAGGLTPLEAITAATGNAARAIKVDAERGTIAPGKLADLILVAGEPHKNIADIEKSKRVFLSGKELDNGKMARDIASASLTPIPAVKAQEQVDDFESPNGRSRLDTLWVNSTDSGVDASKMLFGRINRDAANQALSVSIRMSEKERPFGRINIPLSRGAIEPVDAREFKGVQFDVRGEGNYRFIALTRSIRDNSYFNTNFIADSSWKIFKIDFSNLYQERPNSISHTPIIWTGDDLLMLSFEIARKAGAFGWLELDNIRFYK